MAIPATPLQGFGAHAASTHHALFSSFFFVSCDEGPASSTSDTLDSLEIRLFLRLHCSGYYRLLSVYCVLFVCTPTLRKTHHPWAIHGLGCRKSGRGGACLLRPIPTSRCNTPEDWMGPPSMPRCGAQLNRRRSVATAQATRRQSHGSFPPGALIADDACPPLRDDDRMALFSLEAGERFGLVWRILGAVWRKEEPFPKHSHVGPALLPSALSTTLPVSILYPELRASLIVTPSTSTMAFVPSVCCRQMPRVGIVPNKSHAAGACPVTRIGCRVNGPFPEQSKRLS